MDITQALADALSAEKAIRRGVTQQAMADATGLSRHSVMRKLAGKREITMHELRGFAAALGTTATALMADAEDRIAKSERAREPASQPAPSRRNRRGQGAEGQLEPPARQGEGNDGDLSPSVLEALAKQQAGEWLRLHRAQSPAETKPRRRRPS